MIDGKRIRDLRKNAGLTQRELGLLIGVQQTTLGRFERGEIYLSLPKFGALCAVLGVSADYLLCTSRSGETIK